MRQTETQVLQEARRLLVNKGWTQHAYARDSNGYSAIVSGREPVCFCLSGAINQVSDTSVDADVLAKNRIMSFIDTNIPSWNDKANRTKEEVIALLDRAIADSKFTGFLRQNNKVLHVGDIVKDFRGDDCIVKGWYIPGEAARGARVELCVDLGRPESSGLFFTGVISAKIVTLDGEEYTS